MSANSAVTRRRLVASAAASVAGATAVNAAAIVAAKSVEADPIFPAIEQHRTAHAEWTQLVRIADELPCGSAKIGVYGGMTKPMTFTIDGKAREYPAEPFYLRTHEEIDKHIAQETERLLKKGKAAWIVGQGEMIEQSAALHTELQRQEEAATDPELEAAETTATKASDMERRALQASSERSRPRRPDYRRCLPTCWNIRWNTPSIRTT